VPCAQDRTFDALARAEQAASGGGGGRTGLGASLFGHRKAAPPPKPPAPKPAMPAVPSVDAAVRAAALAKLTLAARGDADAAAAAEAKAFGACRGRPSIYAQQVQSAVLDAQRAAAHPGAAAAAAAPAVARPGFAAARPQAFTAPRAAPPPPLPPVAPQPLPPPPPPPKLKSTRIGGPLDSWLNAPPAPPDKRPKLT
jgi:hypothetical protein